VFGDEMTTSHEFPALLTAARKAAGFETAAEFAEEFGIAPLTYRHWERGTYRPDARTIEMMCAAFGVPSHTLLKVHVSGL